MLKFYSDEQVHQALDFVALADVLATAFAQGATVPLRHVHALSESGTLLLMPAWHERALGTKIVTVTPDNAARGVPTVHALYLLLDRATGAPRAVIDGEALTLRRTAAMSALAARYLALPDAKTMLIVGTGQLARFMALAHYALRPGLQRVRVWGRNMARAQSLAQRLRDANLPAEAVEDLEAEARGAQIISCATTATAPIIHGSWLAAGTHLDLVGGFKRNMREADDAAVARATLFVDTYAGAIAEAGDLQQPLERGVIDRAAIVAELAQLARGEHPGRTQIAEITLYKSVGTALADLAAAELLLQRAANG